jgi:hypothetical protein
MRPEVNAASQLSTSIWAAIGSFQKEKDSVQSTSKFYKNEIFLPWGGVLTDNM